MYVPTREETFAICEQIGAARVRADLDSNTFKHPEDWFARQWLSAWDEAESAEREEVRRAETEKVIAAAERSARAAETSARYAGLAVIVSFAALLISAWPYLPLSK